MATVFMNGNRILDDENKEVTRQELNREAVRREVKALVRQVADGYAVLRSLMEQNPWLADEMDAEDRERKRDFDDKLRKGLSRANDAPRCRWVKQDGTSCRSPQMRKHIYCYAHRQMMEARALALKLPAMEDANAVQVALMRVQKALIDDQISMKKAGLLLYSLQLGMTNVGKTTFGKAADDELVAETVEEQEALQEETGVEPERAIYTGDVPGLREYQKIGPSGPRDIGPSENQTLPRMEPTAQRDLGQVHNASPGDARLAVASALRAEPYAEMG